MGVNTHDPPRTAHLMAMVKDYNNRRRQENELNAFVDRGIDTEARFGTIREFRRTNEILLTTDTFIACRTRMDLLLSQYMLLRSEDRRHADLCDLVAVESLNEAGFQKNVQMLILRLAQGKVSISFLKLKILIIYRQIKKDVSSMPVPFEIKQSNCVRLVLSPSIFFRDLMLRRRNGHLLMIDFNGIRQSSLRPRMILIQ